MATTEDIAHQQRLLEINRRNLAHYLSQQAALGGPAYVPPGVTNGMREARESIRRIKGILRSWNVQIEDHPDDEPPASAAPADAGRPASGGNSTVNIYGGTFHGSPIGNTGGATAFNQPNWSVQGNVYNIAGDLNLGPNPGKDEFLAALRQFRGELDKAEDLPTNKARYLKGDLDDAIEAAESPEPDKERLGDKLQSVKKILDGLAGSAQSAKLLVPLVGELLAKLPQLPF